MTLRRSIVRLTLAMLALGFSFSAVAQGAFQDLDFEEANPAAGVFFPGWELFEGTTPIAGGYDASQAWGFPYINVYDEGMGPYYPVIQGNYSALLSSDYSSSSNGSVTLSQTGIVPPSTQSIQLDANENESNSFVVTLGGNTINMVPVQTFSGYTLYGCNISGWGGKVATLTITQLASQEFSPSTMELDNIVFSPATVTPEPPPPPAAVGLLYVTNSDGTSVTITGYSGTVPSVLVIPTEINGLTVNAVGDSSYDIGAFANATGLENVFIPSGVSIDDYAFEYSGLTNVTISDGVTYIGVGAFRGCTGLAGMVIPASVTAIPEDAFVETGITSVTIPSSVTSIDFEAFAACANLTNVVIEPGLTSLGNNLSVNASQDMFAGEPMLRTVTISGTVTNITGYAFAQCTNLTQIYFMGNAPQVDNTVFREYIPSGNPFPPGQGTYYYIATAYYLPGTTGWAEFSSNTLIAFPEYANPPGTLTIPAVLWNPTIQTAGPDFGVQSNQFGFDITGTTNIPIVVEACTNLAQPVWVPLQSMMLTNGLVHFSDPQWASYPCRFYGIGFP